jgi:AraC-like DNA-binding protein
MEANRAFPVRPDWMFEVRSHCQSFNCLALHADRAELETALTWLAHSAPAAESIQEADALKDRLKDCAIDAGVRFHQEYHRRAMHRQCRGSAVESAMHIWSHHQSDPRVTLQRWIPEFLTAFDATHPSSPAERAAAVLRSTFRNPSSLNALAIEVGASRSGLTRDFQRRYGIPSGEYSTRVRLRWFIEELCTTSASAASIAREAGYDSYHNLVDALRRRTGLTPNEIRGLSHDEVRELISAKLALLGRSELAFGVGLS